MWSAFARVPAVTLEQKDHRPPGPAGLSRDRLCDVSLPQFPRVQGGPEERETD